MIKELWKNSTPAQRLAGIGVIIGVLTLVVLLIMYAFGRPDYLKIANLAEYTEGRPTSVEEVRRIEENLYVMVNKYKRVRSNGVKDFMVRDGTFEQRDEDDYHIVKFLIDSESLRQSYAVSYQWGNRDKFEQYVGMIFCVPEEDVIYDDFACRDPMAPEGIPEERSALYDYIPYDTEHFSVRSDIRTDPISLVITVGLAGNDPEGLDETYYQEAIKWLESTDLDLSKYMLVKRVIRPTVQK